MPIELRPITADEYEQHGRVQGVAFGFDFPAAGAESRRAILPEHRSLAAFDGPEMVATGGAFEFDMTVPGGTVPCSGVTMISVLPTHRRRGILTAMMRRQMDDARAWGEPIAALWASEAGIYGRFGYGLASENIGWTLEREYAALRDEVSPPGRVRLVDPETARSLVEPLWDRLRFTRPGHFTRSATWWERRILWDPEWRRDGFTARQWLVYEEGNATLGWTAYRRKMAFVDHWIPDSVVRVDSQHAATPAAERALWEYLLGIDLNAHLEATERPSDEPLYHLLVDPRRLRRRPNDSLWVRLVDIPAALAARRYAVPGSLVVEVRDDFCPWNSGRYRLEGGPGGAACTPTGAPADLELTAESLGAIYLGGTRLASLAAAGRAAGDANALRLADVMFSWSPAPWCPEVF